MDFGVVLKVLLRRWLLGTLGLVLTAGAVIAVYTTSPRVYQSSSQTMVLLPPTANSPVVESSPFLYLPSGLTTLAQIVALTPATEEFRRSMAADGFVEQYEISAETTRPVIRFTVQGSDPVGVLATRDELMLRYAAELERVQLDENVPTRQFAHMRYLEASRKVDAMSGDRFRAAAGAGVAGVLLTLLAMFIIDRALRDRLSRHRSASPWKANQKSPGRVSDPGESVATSEPDRPEATEADTSAEAGRSGIASSTESDPPPVELDPMADAEREMDFGEPHGEDENGSAERSAGR